MRKGEKEKGRKGEREKGERSRGWQKWAVSAVSPFFAIFFRFIRSFFFSICSMSFMLASFVHLLTV